MMLRISLLLLMTSVLAVAAPVPKQKVKDAEAIEGRWKIVEMARPGLPKADGDASYEVVFKKGKIDVSCDGIPIEVTSLTYKLDLDKGHFDVQRTNDVDGDDISKGIYQLDGDSLTVTLAKDGETARPKDANPGEDLHHFKFRRLPEVKK